MPPFNGPHDPVEIIQSFDARHGVPAAGSLLLFAVWTVDSLYYLEDLDRADDLSQPTIRGHRPDVVDVAHARWATGGCATALDLGAAGLGRALAGHTGQNELDLASLRPNGKHRQLRARLPATAIGWVDTVLADPDYHEIRDARNLLTHAKLLRHFSLPRQRLRLDVGRRRIDVPTLVQQARDVATRNVTTLVSLLPQL
jgi:hypothetical protein